jgi:hypothetical protein
LLDDDGEEVKRPRGRGRPPKTSYAEIGSDNDDDGHFEAEVVAPTKSTWLCDECTSENASRARTCEVCSAKKPSATAPVKGRGTKRGRKPAAAAPAAKKSKKQREQEDEEGGEDEDEEVEVDLHAVIADATARGDERKAGYAKALLDLLSEESSEPFWAEVRIAHAPHDPPGPHPHP